MHCENNTVYVIVYNYNTHVCCGIKHFYAMITVSAAIKDYCVWWDISSGRLMY